MNKINQSSKNKIKEYSNFYSSIYDKISSFKKIKTMNLCILYMYINIIIILIFFCYEKNEEINKIGNIYDQYISCESLYDIEKKYVNTFLNNFSNQKKQE